MVGILARRVIFQRWTRTSTLVPEVLRRRPTYAKRNISRIIATNQSHFRTTVQTANRFGRCETSYQKNCNSALNMQVKNRQLLLRNQASSPWKRFLKYVYMFCGNTNLFRGILQLSAITTRLFCDINVFSVETDVFSVETDVFSVETDVFSGETDVFSAEL